MKINTPPGMGVTTMITLGAFVVVVAGMRAAETLLVPFLLSVFIAIIAAPPLFWLQRKGWPSVVALVIVVAGVLGVVISIGALLGTSLDSFLKDMPIYQERLREEIKILVEWLDRHGISMSSEQVLTYIDPSAAMGLVAGMLNGLRHLLVNSFLIFLTVVFMLLEASSFPAKLRAILDNPEASLVHFDKFIADVKRYLAIKTTTSLLTGLVITAWLLILGVDYPLLWGLLAFLLNYIPNIGSIIAAVPTILLALIQLGVASALWVALGYLVVNSVVGSMIEPKFMGRGLGLSTLVVFISLVFWGWVFGPVGMFLSVPLTMTIKIALDSSEDTKWLATLLGPEFEAQPEPNASVEEATIDEQNP